MERQEILDILKETDVMQEGHFLLTSGKHSNRYMQCAQLFQYPAQSRLLCGELARRFVEMGESVDLVVGPALGGIIMAYQMADCLGIRNIFAERVEGNMTFRRGFAVSPGESVLVCEDVVTTGGSVKEVIALLQDMGAKVVGVGAIVDRSKGQADFGVPFLSVIDVDFDVYEAESCPLCAAGGKAVKPGSRSI